MSNEKTVTDIINDEYYERLIDIVKDKNRFISETGILNEYCDNLPIITKSTEVNVRKKLKRLVKENIFLTKTKREILQSFKYCKNSLFSKEEIRKFYVFDFTDKKQRYYYYPKHANSVLIRLRRMYHDIEKHDFVSEEDLAQINRNIINFSLLFSGCESNYNIVKYNLEREKLIEKNPKLAAILNDEIKIESETPALFNILNRLINGDKVMKYIFISNEGYMQLMIKSINEINDMFLTLHKYYNSQFLATRYLGNLEIHTVSVGYEVSGDESPLQNIDISQFVHEKKENEHLSKLRGIFRKLFDFRDR